MTKREETFKYIEYLQELAYSKIEILNLEVAQSESAYSSRLSKAIDEIKLKLDVSSDQSHIQGEIDNIRFNLPTRFENPYSYSILLDLSRRIRLASKYLSLSPCIEPVVGTLPSGRVNAIVAQAPTNEYVVLFEAQTFNFVNYLTKIIARAFPSGCSQNGSFIYKCDAHSMASIIESKPIIQSRFNELLFAFLFHETLHTVKPYILEDPYSSLASVFLDSVELFLFGHEYSHVLANHFSSNNIRQSVNPDINLREVEYSWQQEIEADVLGMKLMLTTIQFRGCDQVLGFLGPYLFFAFMSYVEKALYILGYADMRPLESKTHPPAKTRKEGLRTMLTNSLSPDLLEAMLKTTNFVECVLSQLWANCQPLLERKQKQGLKLAKRWELFGDLYSHD